MSSSSGDSNIFTTVLSGEGGSKWQIVIALLASSVGFVVAIVNSAFAYFRDKKQMEELAAQERRFEAFKKELEDKQRRLVRYENVQELMKQYKKPLLQSAFDLQSRLANQVRSNFLCKFANQGDRDKEYARLNMAFVIAEFLGWLEVIRQEIVFIVGEGTANLNMIIDAIKFQFTGDTPCQGKSNEPKEADEHWQVLQLYAGELRAIGEVMLTERADDDDNTGSNLAVIGYAEFQRRCNATEPEDGALPIEVAEWKSSKARLQQETLKPLMHWIDKLMELDDKSTPTKRMTMLQVLLCKLIDVLDNAVPYEVGPEYDLENNEEPRYITRDFRLTPLVGRLTKKQLEWLADQRFMVGAYRLVDWQFHSDWWNTLCEGREQAERTMYEKVAFPGFREDLRTERDGSQRSQESREKALGKDGWPGACPPKSPRVRDTWWWAALSHEAHKAYMQELYAKGRRPPPQHMGGGLYKSLSLTRGNPAAAPDARETSGYWPFSILRKRKGGGAADGHANNKVSPVPAPEYDPRPAILTTPSVHQLRWAPSAAASPTPSVHFAGASGRGNDAIQPMGSNPRTNAGL
ncbi:hypothetical protein CHLRE_17g723950v5 [Chlamydomonas reinhardtii]|uniref:Uncharacterized protein n=1 Tax=Chlamydomonas reinhardtii TaxID=3055 RepID=A0A2K3CQJ3_CHLRE|nr:uncharacterized protein CHLRE_17g723950v5 [Chlamydomonas reinhardtii]PNW70533.1 hypothetical protein CHLRE_17g723950v5 [Chlamydomonas reinhardtii]